MNGNAKVLITGIGCVGKSTLRRRVAEALGRKVVCIDRDDVESEPRVTPDQVLVIESVHGLDEPPEKWGLVVYLLPPRGHTLRWIRRGIAWFRKGKVDRPPQVERRSWSLQNIPLIVRLVGRNVWNASRWVKEDRKHINNIYPEYSVVITRDQDLAFHEILNFISRTYEKRENMTEHGEISDDTLKAWIKESIELDLIYDEENFEAIEGKTKWEEDLFTFEELNKKKNDFDSKILAQEKIEILNEGYEYFKLLKKSRVFFGLTFDDVKRKYLEPCCGIKHEDVKKIADERIENLDRIMWSCAATISTLRAWEIKEPIEINARNTLIALFHSEICASSTLDISWGHASGFSGIFLKETRENKADFKGYRLFELIARHNIARGLNHQMLPLEAKNKIDKFVDEYLNIKTYEEKRTEIEGIYIIDTDDFYRALIFPMTLTLSQALNDLRRYTEERHYLNQALKISKYLKDGCYWQKLFELHLAINNKDRGFSETDSMLTTSLGKYPRAENTRRSVRTSFIIDKSNHTDYKSCKNSYIDQVEDWEQDEISVLKWYSAEERPFSRHLETMSKSILQILKCPDSISIKGKKLKAENVTSIKNEIKSCIKIVLDTAFRRIVELRNISFLTKELDVSDLDNKTRNEDFTSQWIQGEWLFKVLNEFNPLILDPHFEKWQSNLKKILTSDPLRPFHSNANEVATLQEKLKPNEEFSDWCPKCNSEECDKLCPARKLMTDDPYNEKIVVASLDYYLDIMSGQQKRFLRYIQKRTGRNRFYQEGETSRKSPCFEIICLRRWNSFSPNLGSRAATTVGGGYFVRAWDGIKKRYIGIVIDPGYNFLENFFNEGFTITDVDLVVITHAHPDHIENFTNLLTLLRERNKRVQEVEDFDVRTSPLEHRILLAMTEGVYERIRLNLNAEDELIQDIVVLSTEDSRGNEAGKAIINLRLDDNLVCHMGTCDTSLPHPIVSFRAASAWHNDYTGYDTMGVIIEYHRSENGSKNDNRKTIGIIGDSRYTDELYKDYKECNVLVTHLGSLINEKDYRNHDNEKNDDALFDCKKLSKLLSEENHLYLPGIALLLCDLQTYSGNEFPLIILSEFGEELRGGLRKDFVKRLSHPWNKGKKGKVYYDYDYLPIIAGDVGLRIDIENRKVFCCICHRYEKPEKIITETVMPDEESMAYVCEDCKELRGGELNTLLEEWCRSARPVVPLESTKEQ